MYFDRDAHGDSLCSVLSYVTPAVFTLCVSFPWCARLSAQLKVKRRFSVGYDKDEDGGVPRNQTR